MQLCMRPIDLLNCQVDPDSHLINAYYMRLIGIKDCKRKNIK